MPFFGSLGILITRLLVVAAAVSAVLSEISTFIGSGVSGYFDGSIRIGGPRGVAVDSAEIVYVAGGNRIRSITPTGIVSTFAGSGAAGSTDGVGTNASFDGPIGMTFDTAGVLYVTDSTSGRIRKITPAGVVTTLAGGNPILGFANGTGTNAGFSDPNGVAVDSSGTVYVADTANYRIRKITPLGVVTTFAGSTSGFLDGSGTNARFTSPYGIALDLAGNMYVTDSSRIRRITPLGVVSTLAGSGTMGVTDGSGTNAEFKLLRGIAVDSSGTVYVADQINNNIRRITSGGIVTTIAGLLIRLGYYPSFADGTGTNAGFNDPLGLAIDSARNIYVADQANNRIRKITTTNVVTTFAGNGLTGLTDSVQNNGTVSGALLNLPRAVAVDSSSTMYVADTANHRIRKITSTGVVTTLAGDGTADFADGIGTNARFNTPQGITVDSAGFVYVSDTINNRIRKITPAGVVTTLAGSGIGIFVDGVGTSAALKNPYGITVDSVGNVYVVDKLNYRIRKILTNDIVSTLGTGLTTPHGIAVDSAGNVFVADESNHRIHRVTPAGVITIIAGSGTAGSTDGTGTNASFRNPRGITIDQTGTLYVTDTNNHRIRTITPARVVTTLAGNGTAARTDGTGTNSSFNAPEGISIALDGALYVGDTNNNSIRKIEINYVSTFAGSSGLTGFVNGTGTNAQFRNPRAIVFNSVGDMYVADSFNNRIRKITPDGAVTTFAGSGASTFANGVGASAAFSGPSGLTIDSSGNLYVGDTGNHRIRKITPAGVVTTVAGSTAGFVNGTGTNATFRNPYGITVDSAGNLYVADQTNHSIRKITADAVVTTLAGSGTGAFADGTGGNARFNTPWGLVVDSSGNVYVGDSVNNRIRKITPAGVVTTLAGTTSGYQDGTGTSARFNRPRGITIHPTGDLYVTDTNNHRIRRVTPAGVVTTFAGGSGSGVAADGPPLLASFATPEGIVFDAGGDTYISETTGQTIRKIVFRSNIVTTLAGQTTSGSMDGTGTTASFNSPNGITMDSFRTLYVSDRLNNRIRAITPQGIVTTFAGSGTQGFLDGAGTNANFNNPKGIVVDSAGNVYVGDSGNNRIRVITPAGVVSTFAGTGSTTFADGEALTIATFNNPFGLAIDSNRNLYIGDTVNGRVRKISRIGTVTTLAGNGTANFQDGTGTGAMFFDPFGIVVNSAGTDMYITDSNYIRKITSAGVTTSIAGRYLAGYGDGTGFDVSFNRPREIALLAAGTSVYVADTGNHIIRRVTTDFGVTTTYSGAGGAGFIESPVANVQYNTPSGIAINSAGLVYVADTTNNRIRTIAAGSDNTGVVTTVVGTSTAGYSDGGGWFNSPFGVATDWDGTVYVADTINNRIRKITPAGVVTTLAGSGTGGFADGTGTSASFNGPRGITVNSAGTVYVADTNNHRIRTITPAGVVSTFAGNGTAQCIDDIGPSAAFNAPNAITINSSGIMYVADTGNHNIRRITQAGVVTTFAGTAGFSQTGNTDGTGTNARFVSPQGIVADMYENIYVADTNNHRIRKITSTGVVTTFAGSTAGIADGIGTNAKFNFPSHLSIDALGTLYVADQTNRRIRTVQPSTGVVSTLAGDGTAGFTPSRFSIPQGITIDRFRNAYVADSDNHSIRKIPNAFTLPENNGVVTTFAGQTTYGSMDGTGFNARFSVPSGFAFDSAGNMYVADTGNHRIRKITPAGVVTTLAGQATSGSTDGSGTNARFNNPSGVAVDSVGNVFVADTNNHRIRRITEGLVTTLAGSTSGFLDGSGTNTMFNSPRGVAVDSAGIVYVVDSSNHRIRGIYSGTVVTLAGNRFPGFADGTEGTASFSFPWGIAVDRNGIVYVGDSGNNRIRKVTVNGFIGNVTTLAGQATSGSTDGTATNAGFSSPSGVTVDSMGTVYVADANNHRIRKITPGGVVTTLAGNGTTAFVDGVGTNATFNNPQGIAVDSVGNVFVADTNNHRIRKIGTTVAQVPLNRGVVTTIAGNGTVGFSDGTGTNTRLTYPSGIGFDSAGNVYVADTGNHRIRKITSTGVVTTFAGNGTAAWGDGTGTSARFNTPNGIAVDSAGTVYVADTNNSRIRKITPAGDVTTLAGSTDGYADGTVSSALFSYPYGITIDSAGNLYVTDQYNYRIRKITLGGIVSTLAGNGTSGYADGTGTNARFGNPLYGITVANSGNLYVVDNGFRIRKITSAGVVTTLAGSGGQGSSNGTGTNATFNQARHIAIDGEENVYVADSFNYRIRKITSAGVVTTFIFVTSTGIAIDSSGILYTTDGYSLVQKIQ